jgi:hypothetical protein
MATGLLFLLTATRRFLGVIAKVSRWQSENLSNDLYATTRQAPRP